MFKIMFKLYLTIDNIYHLEVQIILTSVQNVKIWVFICNFKQNSDKICLNSNFKPKFTFYAK